MLSSLQAFYTSKLGYLRISSVIISDMASLDSVKQKIIRAAEHLKSLEGEQKRYFEEKPGDVMPEVEPSTGRVILRFTVRTPIPVSIPLIIGDALQNLRSSLDYLVWELVLAANNKPSYKNMFPICDTIKSFENQLRGQRLEGVSPEATTEIEGLQPYHCGERTESSALRIIDLFCNINKHRRILLTIPAVSVSRTEFISTESGHSVQQTLTPRYPNAEIAVGPVPTRLGEEVEVKGDALFFIMFNEGAAKDINIAGVLNQLWHFVDKTIVPKFEKFFI